MATWDDEEIAVIRGSGIIFGQVSTVVGDRTKDDRQAIDISPRVTFGTQGINAQWILPPFAKTIQRKDLICVFQGSNTHTIIRPHGDYFSVIALSVNPSEPYESGNGVKTTAWLDQFGSGATVHQLLLAWDWKPSPPPAGAQGEMYAAFISKRLPRFAGVGLEVQEDKITRLENTNRALSDWNEWKARWRPRRSGEYYPCPFLIKYPLRFNCREF